MEILSLGLQRIRKLPSRTRVFFIIALVAAGTLFLTSVSRVTISSNYHDFADKRLLSGIPNALNVLSNIPFVIVGFWALFWLLGNRSRSEFLDTREQVVSSALFAGVLFTGFGSFWYHMRPSDTRLIWDLLPMTCSFTSMVAITVMDRVSVRAGFILFLPLLFLGIGSVVYWFVNGDYKYYLFVQFFAPIVLLALVVLFAPRHNGTRYLAIAFGCYLAAKMFETYDYPIYRMGYFVSGHTLKHVTAAISCFWLLLMLQTWPSSLTGVLLADDPTLSNIYRIWAK